MTLRATHHGMSHGSATIGGRVVVVLLAPSWRFVPASGQLCGPGTRAFSPPLGTGEVLRAAMPELSRKKRAATAAERRLGRFLHLIVPASGDMDAIIARVLRWPGVSSAQPGAAPELP
jgi:hypothetical protein